MNQRFWQIFGIVTTLIIIVAAVFNFRGSSSAAPSPATHLVTEVIYGKAYKVQHTFKCAVAGTMEARDWHFVDRWVRSQLSYDTYITDGRVFQAFRIVANDPTLPRGHVRFRKEVISMSGGPSLEGHDYHKVLLNGQAVQLDREVLVVEYNGVLESQALPLPVCGTPRS